MIPPAELADRALEEWPPGSRANPWEKLAHFIRYARDDFDLSDAAVALNVTSSIRWFCFCIHNPGRTALLVMAPLSEPDDSSPLLDSLDAMARYETAHGTALLQALLPPSQKAEGNLLADAGYTRLAELIYMEGPLPASRDEVRNDPPVTPYSPQREELFGRVIESTYADTLDCPGLEGIRRIEDTLVGHRNSGVFRPELWFLYGHEDSPDGVALLNEVSDSNAQAVELVYMGVTPSARGHGLGRRMLAHAMSQAKAAGYSRLLLAVDDRNTPAMRLYQHAGMRETMRRIAWILSTSRGPAD